MTRLDFTAQWCALQNCHATQAGFYNSVQEDLIFLFTSLLNMLIPHPFPYPFIFLHSSLWKFKNLIFTVIMLLRIFLAVCPQFVKLFVSKLGWHLSLITTCPRFWVFEQLGSWWVGQPTCLFIKTQEQFYKETKFDAQAKPAWLSNRAGLPHTSCQNCKHFLGNCGHIGYIILVFNNYSSSPNGLWVNSPWGQRPNGLLT